MKSTVKSRRQIIEGDADAYAMASGRSPAVRSVQAKIYGNSGKVASGTGRAASAVRPGPEGTYQKIVPQKAESLERFEAPINNMGENCLEGNIDVVGDSDVWTPVSDEDLGHVDLVLTDKGTVKTVMYRVPSETQCCVIDWINFTVAEDTFQRTARQGLLADEQFVEEASRQFEKVFGFGVTLERDRGMNFYKRSWVLGDDMGFVCFGGQRSTMLITLTGQGCANAVTGWEKRLHDWLTKVAVRPSISRIDLAHDDIEGAYLSPDWADEQWSLGGFTGKRGGRPPEIQHVGNWKRPSGKGRTLTVGMRTSSKFCRVYEKGRKEGDRESLWTRFEIEFKNSNTVIEPAVLLNPSDYFVGAYPCCAQFATSAAPTRMTVKQKAAHINMDDAEAIVLRQMGRYIRVFRELYGDKEALDRLCTKAEDYWPKRLKVLTSDATSGPIPIHRLEEVEIPSFGRFITTLPSYGLNGDHGFNRPH